MEYVHTAQRGRALMIDMKIGSDERSWTAVNDIEEDWVRTCLRHLQTTSSSKCVRFRIKTDTVNLFLGTPVRTYGRRTTRCRGLSDIYII